MNYLHLVVFVNCPKGFFLPCSLLDHNYLSVESSLINLLMQIEQYNEYKRLYKGLSHLQVCFHNGEQFRNKEGRRVYETRIRRKTKIACKSEQFNKLDIKQNALCVQNNIVVFSENTLCDIYNFQDGASSTSVNMIHLPSHTLCMPDVLRLLWTSGYAYINIYVNDIFGKLVYWYILH